MPRREEAVVPREKLQGYLLSESHPIGRHKAAALARAGFEMADWSDLEQQLLAIARSEQVVEVISGPHGAKYVIDGYIESANAEPMRMRTVWMVKEGQTEPRLVTAYPRRAG